MGLEAGDGYISGLVATNPVGATDPKSQGDDHIRLIKTALLGTFPNLNGAVTAAPAELNILDGATLSTAELNILDGVTLTASQINDAARKSVANTFTANPTIQSASAARLFLDDSGAGSELRQFAIESDGGHFAVISVSDAGAGIAAALDITKNSSGTITAMELAATAITVNGVDVTDFARLSQSNTFTGSTQLISATGADATLNLARVGGVTTSISGSSSFGILGTTSNHPLAVLTNGTTRFEISAAGAFDFKGGAVLASAIANSTSTTLVAGQLHFVTGAATLPNLTAGQWIEIINDSGSSITISKNASDTTYWTATGASVSTSFTLAARGRLSAVCSPAGNVVYVSGNITAAT